MLQFSDIFLEKMMSKGWCPRNMAVCVSNLFKHTCVFSSQRHLGGVPASLLGAQRPNLLGQLLLRKALQINKLCTATHTAPVLNKTAKLPVPEQSRRMLIMFQYEGMALTHSL